jgi:hypothetical protein
MISWIEFAVTFPGIKKISAGNYGGKLGKYQFKLHDPFWTLYFIPVSVLTSSFLLIKDEVSKRTTRNIAIKKIQRKKYWHHWLIFWVAKELILTRKTGYIYRVLESFFKMFPRIPSSLVILILIFMIKLLGTCLILICPTSPQ